MSVRRVTAAVLTAGLLLAGCSDDPEPRFEPTESPSPTESSSSAAPEAQSPEDFIQDWFDLAVEMQNSGDADGLLEASANCAACERLVSQVEAIYDAGGSVKIESMRVESVRKDSGTTFRTVVRAAATTVRRDGDSKAETLPANTNTYFVTLQRNEDSWLMKNYEDTPS